MHFYAANPLQPLIDFFEAILVFFHDNIGLSWGAAIIAMTLVVRAALLPLTLKQFKSMQSLAAHQPELKRLQEKYKGDRDRMNQEMMKFYKENRINPLASCLPMLAQLPVFIALFYMLQNDLRREICPEINPPSDLTDKATGGVLVALILMYIGSQMLSTYLSTVTADRNQRLIMFALPLVFVFFVIRFPAGLLLYWITTNLWTIVQQTIVRRRLGPLKPPDDPNAEKPGGLAGFLGLPAKSTSTVPTNGSGGGAVPAARAAGASGAPARPAAPPPAPPRKKKKRSGRRR
jgi:YidC/Oxa1 family membrane protein insertase